MAAHSVTPIKLEINTSEVSELEGILETVRNLKEKHPDIIVTIRVQ